MGKVIAFPGPTVGPVPVEKVLEGAMSAGLEDVIVIGWDADGFYGAASSGDGPELLFLLEMARHKMMKAAVEGSLDG